MTSKPRILVIRNSRVLSELGFVFTLFIWVQNMAPHFQEQMQNGYDVFYNLFNGAIRNPDVAASSGSYKGARFLDY
jgi:hypothetical protein